MASRRYEPESRGTTERFPRFTPEQQKLLATLLQLSSGRAGALGAPIKTPSAPALKPLPGIGPRLEQLSQAQDYSFAPIAQRARQQFEEGLPGLAERFISLGGPTALQSPSFLNALARGKQSLESNLAAERAAFGERARGMTFQELAEQNRQQLAQRGLMNQLALAGRQQELERYGAQGKLGLGAETLRRGGIQSLLQFGFEPQYETIYTPPPIPAAQRPSFWSQLGSGIANVGTLGLGKLFGLF